MNITSRYAKCKVLNYKMSSDEISNNVEYHSRRFIPPPANYKVEKEVVIKQGERLDLTAQNTLGQYENFWAIVDINRTMNPFALMQNKSVGSYMKIPSPLSIICADGPVPMSF